MIIFIAIAVAGFILASGGFIFGHDHDVGHGIDHGIDHGDAASEHTVSIFSMKVIATLLMGFGAAGAIAKYEGLEYLASSGVGVLFGLVLSAIMYGFLCLIAKQQGSSLFPTSSLIGSSGTVTVPIDEGCAGEVGVTYRGNYSNYTARSVDGKPVPKGIGVRIVKAEGSHLIVKKVD
jgi:membrane protein implicated in regulation of membrane protease activity